MKKRRQPTTSEFRILARLLAPLGFKNRLLKVRRFHSRLTLSVQVGLVYAGLGALMLFAFAGLTKAGPLSIGLGILPLAGAALLVTFILPFLRIWNPGRARPSDLHPIAIPFLFVLMVFALPIVVDQSIPPRMIYTQLTRLDALWRSGAVVATLWALCWMVSYSWFKARPSQS